MENIRAGAKIQTEYRRASILFPEFNTPHEGYAIIKEELDELWEAVKLKQSNPERLVRIIKEVTQVGAMALRFLIDLCEDNDGTTP